VNFSLILLAALLFAPEFSWARGGIADRGLSGIIDLPDPSLEDRGKEWLISETGRWWTEGAHLGKICALMHREPGGERCVLISAPLCQIKPGMKLRVAFFARWLSGENDVSVTFQERAPYFTKWYRLWQGVIPMDGQWHCIQADIMVPQFPVQGTSLGLCLGLPNTTKPRWTKLVAVGPDTEYLLDDVSLEVLQSGKTVEPKRLVTPSFVSDDVRDEPSRYGVYWTPWRTYAGTPLNSAHDHDKTRDEICQELDLMQRIGVKWIRSIWRWDKIEWNKGEYDYTLLDYVVTEAWKRDIRVVPALISSPRWASTAPRDEPAFRVYPPNLMDWEAFVYDIVNHFQRHIKYWEVWNEPNIFNRWNGTVEDYFRLQKTAFMAARRADPRSKILLGAFSGSGAVYLDQLLRLGAKDYFDILSCHPYPRSDGLDKIEYIVRGLRLVLADHGCEDRPIWFTEVGWTAEDVGGSDKRMRLLSDLYRRAFGGAVEKRFWYTFDSWSSRPVEEGYSLVRIYQGKVELGSAYHAYGRTTAWIAENRSP
jgi:hypothetical protein